MSCVLVRNAFKLCKFLIFSDVQYSRQFCASPARYLREVHVKTEDNVTVVEGVVVESDRKGKVLNIDSDRDLCPLCPQKIRIPVKYTDVLILSQFIRANGEMLPQHATGLCYKAHQRLQRVVRQAQLAGLIPEPPLEENIEQRLELWHSGFKWRKHNIYYDE